MFLRERIYHQLSPKVDNDGVALKEACDSIESWSDSAKVGDVREFHLPHHIVRAKLEENEVEVLIGSAKHVAGGSGGFIVQPGTRFEKYVFKL